MEILGVQNSPIILGMFTVDFSPLKKFKGPCKSFGYWGLKLLPGIRVIAEGLAQRPRPEPPTCLELHLVKLVIIGTRFWHFRTKVFRPP